ncbi:MAG: membrane protein insertion efficiency factor YidD [Dermatophilus congolensis]|nr:membrane protein insertion efficiency factor YidD [Dermatophilus congolensis]
METIRRIASWPFLVLIKAYQLLISPILPQSCRFYPSCSAYAAEAIRRYGPLRGGLMAARRLGRCHPWNPGGVDHVPPRGPDGRPIRNNEEAQPPIDEAA